MNSDMLDDDALQRLMLMLKMKSFLIRKRKRIIHASEDLLSMFFMTTHLMRLIIMTTLDKVSLMEPVSSLLYSKRCWASSSRVRCAVVEAVAVAAVCTSLLARNGMTSF